MLNKGGHKVAAGTYWNVKNGERVDMEQEGVLPGDRKDTYIKAPGAVVLAAGPILGLIFAVFLPFIGIAMALMALGGKIVEGMVKAASGVVTFGWRPIEAYLTGKKSRKAPREKKGEGGEERK